MAPKVDPNLTSREKMELKTAAPECAGCHALLNPIGFALGHAVGDANDWTHWCLWAHGGKTVEADDKTVAVNKQGTWSALEYAKELYSVMVPGTGSWLDPNNNRAFLAGEVSVTNNGISIYTAAKKDFPQIAQDMDHANFPVGPVGKPTELAVFSSSSFSQKTSFASESERTCLASSTEAVW